MLRGQHSVGPHSIVIVHRLPGDLLSGGVLVLIESQKVVDLFVWLITLEGSGIEILRCLQVFKRFRWANWANMRLSCRKRSLDLPVSLSINLISSNEQAC